MKWRVVKTNWLEYRIARILWGSAHMQLGMHYMPIICVLYSFVYSDTMMTHEYVAGDILHNDDGDACKVMNC